MAIGGRSRLIAAAAALTAALATAASIAATWPFERGQGFLAALAIAGCGCLAVALAGRWTTGVGWGVGILGAEFVVRARLDPGAVAWTPVAAAALLLVAELAMWSYELDGVELTPAASVRRLFGAVALSAGIGALCALVQAVASMVGGGWPLFAAGVGAAVLAVAGLALLARAMTAAEEAHV
jgi:hypothetical protein